MTKHYCDACGEDIIDHGHGSWDIELRFHSSKKNVVLCSKHGAQAARLLGFCYDAGQILSMAQGEYATGEYDIPKITPNPEALPMAGFNAPKA